MARFLRASILKNICGRLFERFPTGTNITVITNHIENESDFSQKTNKKDILKLK